ncbi:hypothetical protein PINS_up002293 [Pythium insidiosum]|nr:hypothetical protein PINS_up002293 [Pythium insidiosum]
MSGWTLDLETTTLAPGKGAPRETRSSTRRAFFDDGDSDPVVTDKRRDSLTLPSNVSRRAKAVGRSSELVMEELDDSHDAPGDNDDAVVAHNPKKVDNQVVRQVVDIADRSGHGKSEELGAPDTVACNVSPLPSSCQAPSPPIDTSNYVLAIVHEFLRQRYPSHVVDLFEREMGSVPNTLAVPSTHDSLLGANKEAAKRFTARLEQLLAVWDVNVHGKKLRHRSRSKDAAATDDKDSSTGSSSSSGRTRRTRSNSSGSSSKKKPTLTVVTQSVDPEPDDACPTADAVDFNRLNHPGHTPKSQDALLASVIGAPGSTPKASAADLKALGFDDVDDESLSIPSTNVQSAAPASDSTDSEVSAFARRKRAVNAGPKRVNIGEPGSTPKKEFLFFRETPPCYVAETIEAAEQALRECGGDPTVRTGSSPTSERFVELQSSDVAKYRVGQSVSNLGAQRNISGIVSKLYGSRQCGTAGPGTIVIDTWNGSDADPELNERR